MIFTTPAFLVFFLIVYALYLAVKRRAFRHFLLLVSSSFFYGWWDWRYLGLMWTVIFVSYFTALRVEARPERRKLYIGWAIATQLALLSVFKYTNFFLQSAGGLAQTLGIDVQVPVLKIILPVGISFYIFHGISYIVDVYRGVIPAQHSLTNVALYISYFPQLVAGPIVRASELIPQLNRDVTVDSRCVSTGLREFTIGLIYKAAFADNLAQFADPVFNRLAAHDNLSLVCASFAFYSQIYFDFAGYSLMAIGLARMMGYNFPENFNHPYRSGSITEFWRRWHISLSTWLKNYLYIPLGGNRRGRIMTYRNLILTMLLGGLWHGASWNFVLWGGLHGLALAVHKLFSRDGADSTAPRRVPLFLLSWLATQLFVLLCWVPFRLPHFSQTMEVFSAFAGLRQDKGLQQAAIPYLLLFLPLAVDTCLVKLDLQAVRRAAERIPEPARPYAIGILIGLIFALALIMMPLSVSPFIYFQF